MNTFLMKISRQWLQLKEQLVALQLSVTGSFLATVMFCGCSTMKGAFWPATDATTSLKHENVNHFLGDDTQPRKEIDQ
jgi:hypothetical protein